MWHHPSPNCCPHCCSIPEAMPWGPTTSSPDLVPLKIAWSGCHQVSVHELKEAINISSYPAEDILQRNTKAHAALKWVCWKSGEPCWRMMHLWVLYCCFLILVDMVSVLFDLHSYFTATEKFGIVQLAAFHFSFPFINYIVFFFWILMIFFPSFMVFNDVTSWMVRKRKQIFGISQCTLQKWGSEPCYKLQMYGKWICVMTWLGYDMPSWIIFNAKFIIHCCNIIYVLIPHK